MTESKENPPSEPPKNEPPKNETKTFTQDDLDKIVGGVRTDVKSAYEKEIAKIRDEFEKERKLSSLKEEERAKVEKEMELKKLNDELSSYKKELALKSAEAELAKLELQTLRVLLSDYERNRFYNRTHPRLYAYSPGRYGV